VYLETDALRRASSETLEHRSFRQREDGTSKVHEGSVVGSSMGR